MREIGGEQRFGDGVRLTFALRPIDQLMGAEGVPHPHVVGVVEREAQRGAHLRQPFARRDRTLQRRAVFGGEMLAQIFAVRRHLRIQLERRPADVKRDADRVGRRAQLARADHAPGANDVRDDLDGERRRSGHRSFPFFCGGGAQSVASPLGGGVQPRSVRSCASVARSESMTANRLSVCARIASI